MNQKEAMIVVQALSLAYPSRFKDETLPMLVSMWAKQFADIPFKQVNEAIIDWIGTEKYAPTIAEIKEKCLPALEYRNPWYEHFPSEGSIEYNDRDLDWVNNLPSKERWEMWKQIPKELEKRMYYNPDPFDDKRNQLLERALKMQKEMREGEQNGKICN